MPSSIRSTDCAAAADADGVAGQASRTEKMADADAKPRRTAARWSPAGTARWAGASGSCPLLQHQTCTPRLPAAAAWSWWAAWKTHRASYRAGTVRWGRGCTAACRMGPEVALVVVGAIAVVRAAAGEDIARRSFVGGLSLSI